MSARRGQRCLALTAAVALGLACERRPAPLAVDALHAAMAAVRLGAGRLAGEPWRPPPPPGPPAPLPPVVRLAAREAQRAASAHGDAASLRDQGVAWLLAGFTGRALADLRHAQEIRQDDSALWTDLAVAHLAEFEATGEPSELVLGLGAADQGVRLDPQSLAARFDRALALERLSLSALARADWEIVARREPDPQWRREAQMHIVTLAGTARSPANPLDLNGVTRGLAQRQLALVYAEAARSPAEFREVAETLLRGSWAAAASSGREEEAEHVLAAIRAVGAALAAAQGDRMLADTAAQLDRGGNAPARVRLVAAGLLSYDRGLHLIAAGRFGAALPVLGEARAKLTQAGSPWAGWASYQAALCHYQELDYAVAERELKGLLRRRAPARSGVLEGRSRLLAGLIYTILGRHAEAIAAYDTALGEFRRLGEGLLAARASVLLAEHLANLGQRQAAWRMLHPVLMDPAARDRPELRQASCVIAAVMALSEGENEVALQFHDEIVRNALLLGQPYRIAGALRSRAGLQAALGRVQAARSDLDQAWTYWRQIPDAATRRSMLGDLQLAAATIAGQDAPREALAALDRAIALFRSTSYHSKLAQALFARAMVEKTLGRTSAVEDDLHGALAEAERQRETISSPEDRILYLDQMREALDTLTQIEIAGGRPSEALAVTERGRARVLWDWQVAGAGGRPSLAVPPPVPPGATDLAALETELPEKTGVVDYAVLPERTVFWYLRRGRPIQWGTLPLGGPALDRLVRQFRRTILGGSTGDIAGTFQGQSELLYESLIRPLSELIRPDDRLILIPDGALQMLPFNLLRDPRSHRFLIQDHVVVMAPSLRALAAGYRRDERLARQSTHRMLDVSAPNFNRALGPTLSPLSGFDARFAGMFPGSRLLSGDAATASAFRQQVGSFEIVHFGGHSIVSADSPLGSRMLFAKSPASSADEIFYSGEVLRTRFTRTRIVVLASCSTALGRLNGTEGIQSLARSFLAAGVPVVVASLWDTDDRATSDLFVSFYRALGKRFDAASALQSAEIDMIERHSAMPSEPAAWGGFQVIGLGACQLGDRAGIDRPDDEGCHAGAGPEAGAERSLPLNR